MASSAWQKHAGPFLKKALKAAASSFKGQRKGPSPAQKKRIKELQLKRADINRQIRKLKGKG